MDNFRSYTRISVVPTFGRGKSGTQRADNESVRARRSISFLSHAKALMVSNAESSLLCLGFYALGVCIIGTRLLS